MNNIFCNLCNDTGFDTYADDAGFVKFCTCNIGNQKQLSFKRHQIQLLMNDVFNLESELAQVGIQNFTVSAMNFHSFNLSRVDWRLACSGTDIDYTSSVSHDLLTLSEYLNQISSFVSHKK